MSGHSLFLALRPPAELARYLWPAFDWLPPGDDRVEPERYHLTLCSLGVWPHHPADVICRVQQACATLTAPPFRIVLDELIVSHHALLKPSERIAALDRFQRALGSQLAGAGLLDRALPPFSPHMTASYRTSPRGRFFTLPISWTVLDFVLIESLIGRRTQLDRGGWRLHNAS